MLDAPHETAAVTVVYPSFLMLTAISNLFGVGGASAIARALGKKDEEGAPAISAISIWGGILAPCCFHAFSSVWKSRYCAYAAPLQILMK